MSETGNPFAFAPSRSDGLRQARELLDKKRFRELFRQGSMLGLDQAVPFAFEAQPDDAPPPPPFVEPSPLTRRELEVADLVADGLSNPQIATRLVISVRTAQGHVENILRKLGFNSRSLIAAWVTERRLAEGASAATAHARPVTVTVSRTDPNGDPFSFAAGRAPAGGSLGPVATSGTVTYTPRQGFFGTDSFTRASTSPRLEPFSRGAPLPFTRRRVPSRVPGLTFTVTGPSGVGTLISAPSDACESATGTSTTRSSPRRVNVFDGSTRVITNRSPASAPP